MHQNAFGSAQTRWEFKGSLNLNLRLRGETRRKGARREGVKETGENPKETEGK